MAHVLTFPSTSDGHLPVFCASPITPHSTLSKVGAQSWAQHAENALLLRLSFVAQ